MTPESIEARNYEDGVACPPGERYESYKEVVHSDWLNQRGPESDRIITQYRCVPGIETDLHILIHQPSFWMAAVGGLLVVCIAAIGAVNLAIALNKRKEQKSSLRHQSPMSINPKMPSKSNQSRRCIEGASMDTYISSVRNSDDNNNLPANDTPASLPARSISSGTTPPQQIVDLQKSLRLERKLEMVSIILFFLSLMFQLVWLLGLPPTITWLIIYLLFGLTAISILAMLAVKIINRSKGVKSTNTPTTDASKEAAHNPLVYIIISLIFSIPSVAFSLLFASINKSAGSGETVIFLLIAAFPCSVVSITSLLGAIEERKKLSAADHYRKPMGVLIILAGLAIVSPLILLIWMAVS